MTIVCLCVLADVRVDNEGTGRRFSLRLRFSGSVHDIAVFDRERKNSMNRKMKLSLLSAAISSALLSPCFAGAAEYVAPADDAMLVDQVNSYNNQDIDQNIHFNFGNYNKNTNAHYNGVSYNATTEAGYQNKGSIWLTAPKSGRSAAVAVSSGVEFTNNGNIYVDGSTNTDSDGASRYWGLKAIWVEAGSEAVNNGLIAVKQAYGMQAGTGGEDPAVLTNNGTISVEEKGVAMELAATGSGNIPPRHSNGYNNGTIVLSGQGTVGVQFKGVDDNTFTNSGDIIVANGTKGILVDSTKASVINEGNIVAEEGGTAISVTGDKGLALTLKGASHIEGDVALNDASSLRVDNLANQNEVLQLTNDALASVDMTNSTLAISGDGNLSVGTLTQDNSTLGLTGTRTLTVSSLESEANLVFDHKLTDEEVDDGQKLLTVTSNADNNAVNVRMTSQVTDTLSGAEEAKELVEKQIDVAGDTAVTTTTFAEGAVLGVMTATRTGANGDIVMTEAKNTVTDSLQKIGAMNFLTFRAQTNDVSKRMGDLRSMPQSDGMWARAVAGQGEYKSIHNTYQTLQIGGDKRIGNFYVGGTASYTDGDGKLNNGSTDDKNYSFGLYGGWINNDGQYVDVTIKRHHLETEYDIYNRSGIKSEGSYDTWGTSASIEYGWRLGIANTNYYIEPQAELMIGHLNGVSHTTNVGTNIKQEGIDTAVGRVGIAAGWISPEKTGSAYLKASVLHDWEGDAKTRVSNKKAMRSYTEDMGGTWGEFALGGTWNINKNFAAYGEVETTAGNPVRTTYQVSGGIRYSF